MFPTFASCARCSVCRACGACERTDQSICSRECTRARISCMRTERAAASSFLGRALLSETQPHCDSEYCRPRDEQGVSISKHRVVVSQYVVVSLLSRTQISSEVGCTNRPTHMRPPQSQTNSEHFALKLFVRNCWVSTASELRPEHGEGGSSAASAGRRSVGRASQHLPRHVFSQLCECACVRPKPWSGSGPRLCWQVLLEA